MTKLIQASDGISSIKLDVSWKKPFYIDCFSGFNLVTYYPEDIESAEEIDEETYRSAGATAGWAIAGGLLTGGIGLIAGAAIGARRRKNAIYLVKFKDGQFVAFQQKGGPALKAFQDYLLKQSIDKKLEPKGS